MKLTVKLIIASVLTAIIPIAILSYLSYDFAKQSLKNQALEDLVLTAEAKEGHLYSFMDAVKGRATDFSSDGFIRDSAKALQRPDIKPHRYRGVQKALNAHLKRNKQPLDKSIRLISVIDLNGKVISSTEDNNIGMDESKYEYFINGIKGVYLSDVYAPHHFTASDYKYYIAVSAPLTNKRTGALLGVIVNFYDTSVLNKILSGEFQLEHGAPSAMLGRRKTLEIYLANKEKLLITPSRFSNEVMKQRVETLPVLESASGREMKGIYKNYLGSEVIGASMHIPSKGWTLLVEMSAKEAFSPVAVMRNRIVGLVIPVGMLAIFLAYLLSKESQGTIRESEERFKAFMDYSPTVAFMKDEEGCHIYINSTFTRYFKITPEHILGKTVFEIWPMEIARRLHANDKSVLSTGKVMETYETVPTPDGVLRDWLVLKFPVKGRSGQRYLGGVAIDVTERKMAEEKLRKLFHAVEQSPATIVITDVKGAIEYANPRFSQLTGYTIEEVIGQNPRILKSGKTPLEEYKRLWDTITAGGDWRGEFCNKKKNGELYWELAVISPVKDPEGIIANFIAIKEDITELKRVSEELKESNERFRLLIESSQDGILAYDKEFRYTLWNKAMEQMSGMSREEVVGKIAFEVFPFLERVGAGASFRNAVKGKPSIRLAMPYNVPQTDRHGYFDNTHFPLFDARGEIIGGMAIVGEATRRVQAERRLNAQHAVTRVLADAAAIEEASPKILQVICEALAWDMGGMWLVDGQADVLRCVEIWHIQLLEIVEFKAVTRQTTFRPGVGLPGRIWSSGRPAWIADVTRDTNFPRAPVAAKEGLHGAFGFPILSGDKILGVVEFFSREIQQPDEYLLNMMSAIGSQMGQFIMRRRAEERTHLQLQRISGLHTIDMAITGSFDLEAILDVFLDKVITLLNVDAADVLLLNAHTQTLEYTAGKGFLTDVVWRSCLLFGEGAAGRAVSELRLISIPDLRKAEDTFTRAQFLADKGFVCHYAAPLVAKGSVEGVLEIFHRTPLVPNNEWLEFLNVLATQGAVVIDNALLFDDLQRSNVELVMAYDRTIEGWSRALDMRDEGTEGHTLRVTQMTLRLAREMGVNDEELVHVRRGALLHDIGKMGIPDDILLKAGPLTGEEWVVMRRHTEYAHAMLSPITYLGTAIDIPYCHHERWDGTGYPRGLKGEQIPLSARIFAVVDVWDALRFDRPYRKGWPEEKIRDHIRSHAGTHFDPKVAETFLKMEW